MKIEKLTLNKWDKITRNILKDDGVFLYFRENPMWKGHEKSFIHLNEYVVI